MKRLVQGLLAALLVAYPLLVYFGIQALPPATFGLCLGLLALLRLALLRRGPAGTLLQAALAVILLLVVACAVLAGRAEAYRYYPLAVNAALLTLFAGSLWRGPPLVERLARLAEPELPPHAVAYTRKVTVAWCAFFICNGLVAWYTAVFCELAVWALYNGLLSYLLMGLMFAGEWLLRRRVRRKADALSV